MQHNQVAGSQAVNIGEFQVISNGANHRKQSRRYDFYPKCFAAWAIADTELDAISNLELCDVLIRGQGDILRMALKEIRSIVQLRVFHVLEGDRHRMGLVHGPTSLRRLELPGSHSSD